MKDFRCTNLDVVCDASLGAPSMKDCASVVSLFDQAADRKSYEFNREDPPLIKIGGILNCFHLRPPI